MTAGPPVLEATDLSRRYDRRWVLRRVSLSVGPGQSWGLAGDNGAGKSTLLRLAAGLQRPNEGSLAVLGERMTLPLGLGLRQAIGYLGHQVFVYPDLTGRENIAFFQRLYGARGARPDEATAILERVGLAEAADASVRTYSRGMVQRLALGRLLAQGARLWLLDEPTTGLDASGVALLVDLLTELKGRGGAALIATHDLGHFSGTLDGVLRLARGRVVEATRPVSAAP